MPLFGALFISLPEMPYGTRLPKIVLGYMGIEQPLSSFSQDAWIWLLSRILFTGPGVGPEGLHCHQAPRGAPAAGRSPCSFE